MFFLSSSMVLSVFLSSLTACTKSKGPSNNLSPDITLNNSTIQGMQLPDVNDYLIIKYDSNGKQVWQNVEDFGEEDSSVSFNIDASGNSYIIGSNYNVKYDSNGKQVYFHTLINNNLSPGESVLDAQGNTYLIATSDTDGIKIYKYDNNGKQVWAKQYQYPGDLTTLPYGITLDNTGDIYVSGFTSTSADATDDKLLILKFDNQGNLLWSVKDDGLMQGNTAIGPVVDTNGNVYVTGYMLNAAVNSTSNNNYVENYDYVTVKYNAAGIKQWETYYNGPANGYDVPHDIKVDSSGNVIVTGEGDGLGNIREIATIKYNSDGKELWVSRYNGADDFGGTPSAMTVDNQGNIYITGRSFNRSSGDDYVTIKYDSDGQQLWADTYGGLGAGLLNEASVLFVDDNGNVYVTGDCGLDSEYVTYDTIKYGPDGNQLWVASYSKSDFIDIPDMLMVDALGNVYMIGRVAWYSK